MYLEGQTKLLSSKGNLLHFAPEQCLYDRFSAARDLEYVTADIGDFPMVDVRVDIMSIPFSNGSFDNVVCSHVLEHVPDDGQAMREIRRVLRPHGRAYLQHPIDPSRAVTFEDSSIVDPEERLRVFGQWDHVRIYGSDFGDRLRAAGLKVEVVPFRDQVTPELSKRNGLHDPSPFRSDDIYVCSA